MTYLSQKKSKEFYEGQWENNQRNGYGYYRFLNGDVY